MTNLALIIHQCILVTVGEVKFVIALYR